MPNILITGGTGTIGRILAELLIKKGYNVSLLSRTKNINSEINTYIWNLVEGFIEDGAIETADYIVHLAGADIADKRWSKKRKTEIIDSRIKTINLLYKKVKDKNKILKAFISASAIGYYGNITTDKIFAETDAPANDFLGKTCQLWEKAADQFTKNCLRIIKIRIGVVLSKEKGALPRMTLPIKYWFGANLGNGRQYIPWIHINDLCSIFVNAIENNDIKGVFNAVAPDYRTNDEFTRILASVLHKPIWLPNIPGFFLKLIFGKMSTLLLKGSKISPEKILKTGFKYNYPNLTDALKDLMKNN